MLLGKGVRIQLIQLNTANRPSGRTCNPKSEWIYSIFTFTLPNNANYGLILHKHVELIWFYYASCSFLIKIGCNMVIFTDIFKKYYIIKSQYFNLEKLYLATGFYMVIATRSKLTMSIAVEVR